MPQRRCFISFHQADRSEVDTFLRDFDQVFQDRVLGAGDSYEFIDSDSDEYVMRRIRENYIRGTSTTIVLVGRCTWSRKYVDWEIAATLRDNPTDPRGALLGIRLASAAAHKARVPARLSANVKWNVKPNGYADYWTYPSSSDSLRMMIEDSLDRRNRLIPAAAEQLRRIKSQCP